MQKNILIVDDDSIVQFIHQKLIQKVLPEFPIHSFLNSSEAMDYLLNNDINSNTYLVFLDINLIPLNAWSWIELLQKNKFSEKVEIVMVTSSVDPEDLEKSKKYPEIKAFISKPLKTEDIEEFKKSTSFKFFQ